MLISDSAIAYGYISCFVIKAGCEGLETKTLRWQNVQEENLGVIL
jgi:hypothetical protein